MTLQRASNANVRGNRGSAVLSFVGNGVRLAVVSGGTVVDYTDGNITYRQHEIRSGTASLDIQVPGWVETMMLLAGGGGGSRGSGDNNYFGGGGGGGGVYLQRWVYLTQQTITATIGGGGAGSTGNNAGSNGTNSTVTIIGYGTTPGSVITCGGGGGGAGQGGTGSAGNAGGNGGGTGGTGGRGASPGVSSQNGTATLTNFYLDRAGTLYGVGFGGDANRGNGGSQSGSTSVPGGSGIFLIRYPLVTL